MCGDKYGKANNKLLFDKSFFCQKSVWFFFYPIKGREILRCTRVPVFQVFHGIPKLKGNKSIINLGLIKIECSAMCYTNLCSIIMSDTAAKRKIALKPTTPTTKYVLVQQPIGAKRRHYAKYRRDTYCWKRIWPCKTSWKSLKAKCMIKS